MKIGGGGDANDIMVSSSSLPLFANLDAYNQVSHTKASGGSFSEEPDTLLALSSLLDKSKAEYIHHKQYYITATPFKEEYCGGALALPSSGTSKITADSLTFSKIFKVNVVDTEADTSDIMIVTMIPDIDYLSTFGDSNISYIEKGNFTGFLLYSSIDGTLRSGIRFDGGSLHNIYPLTPEESARCQESSGLTRLVSFRIAGSDTKLSPGKKLLEQASSYVGFGPKAEESVDGGGKTPEWKDTLNPIVVIANRKNGPTIPKKPGVSPNTGGETIKTGGGGTGTGGGNGKTAAKVALNEELVTFKVTLSSGEGGTTAGSGEYPMGQTVYCHAMPNQHYWFSRWTGNFAGQGQSALVLIGHSDISATAYFRRVLTEGPDVPCFDKLTGTGNPLIVMELAPTDTGNKDNAIFNSPFNTRYSGKHEGIDFYATPGTPIYAPCDGVIPNNMPFVTKQPNAKEIRDNKIVVEDSNYRGDRNPAGNRIYLEFKRKDGKKYAYCFMHLQAGNAVGYNPREDRNFKPGDKVYRGEIIGYTGITGNAYNVKNPHLHLGVMDCSQGKFTDPEPFINGNTDKSENGKIKSTTVKNINCDEEVEYE